MLQRSDRVRTFSWPVFSRLHLLRIVLSLFIFGIFPFFALGQTGSLSGSVKDTSGALIPHASVKIGNMATGVVKDVSSNSDGLYSATALQPGHYQLSVSSPGFSSFIRTGIELLVDNSTQVDVILKAGSSATTVTVTADAPLIQKGSPEFGSFATSQQFDDLPLIQQDKMRDPSSFVYLTPGVQGNIAVNGSEYVGQTNVILANGGQMYATEIIFEGLPGGGSHTAGSFTPTAPPVDATAEFKMTTTLLPAEYGHTGPAVGSFSIRSGTNTYHGSAYEYIRNSALDATNWLAKHTGAVQKLSKKQNEFGATIGGPFSIPHLYDGRDKTFFFFAYGASRLAGGAAAFTTVLVPTAAQRNGQFGNSAIYDPATTVVTGGRSIRKQFSGNTIDPSRFDPVAKKILAYMPLPNISGSGNNFGAYTGASTLNIDTYTAKMDHYLTANQVLSAVYVRSSQLRITIGSPLGKPLGGDTNQVFGAHTARLNYNWTISPRLLNSAFAGLNRQTNANLPLYQDQNYTAAIGLSGIPDSVYFPGFTFSTNGYAPISQNNDAYDFENDYYFKDRLTWTKGRHLVKGGGEYRIMQYNDNSPYKFLGNFAASNIPTATQSASSANFSGGNSFASFLLGDISSGSVQGATTEYTRKSYTGFFVQDDYRFTDRLTLNLGLRYEWQSSPREARNAQSAIDLNAPNPGAGNRPGVLAFASASRPTFFPTDYSAISPRFGFAFQAMPGTVIRGGYGIYYTDTMPNIGLIRSGYSVNGTFQSPDGAAPAFVLGQGVPETYPAIPTLSPTALNGQAGSYYQPNTGAMPRIQEWSLSVQQAIGANASIEFMYIGNHGTRLVDPQMVNINQLDPKYAALGSLLSQSVTSSAAVAAGIKIPYPGFTGTVAQALRPYPQYLTLTAQGAKVGFNTYHAGQVVYHQRIGNGLTFYGGFTWSKDIGYNSPSLDGSGALNAVLQNAYDRQAERTLIPQDIPYALVFNYIYNLPFGKNQHFLTKGIGNAILGGWKVSGIHRYQSGTPLFIYGSNQTSTTIFNSITRPNVVPGIDPKFHGKFNYDTSRWVNLAAFVQPANFTFGNAAPSYGNLRNFSSFAEDMALVKETRLSERLNWSLYAQASNVFNRHRFYGVTTNISSTTTFGTFSNVSNPRYLQFGTRLRF
jgi:hypothetical protein